MTDAQTNLPITPELVLSTRTGRNSDGARHLTLLNDPDVMAGKGHALCGASQQWNCGGGRYLNFMAWTTCPTCKRLLAEMGPHPKQADRGTDRTAQLLMAQRVRAALEGGA